MKKMNQIPEISTRKASSNFDAKALQTVLKKYGPKKAFKSELYVGEAGGWRSGYTKPTILDRVVINRRKERNRRKVRTAQRQAGQRITN